VRLGASAHTYEVRPRRDKRGFDLISDVHSADCGDTKPDDAVSYAKFFSRSHDAVIRVYDDAGKVIQTHEHAGDFKGRVLTQLSTTWRDKNQEVVQARVVA
jgi:hypothetical protein